MEYRRVEVVGGLELRGSEWGDGVSWRVEGGDSWEAGRVKVV